MNEKEFILTNEQYEFLMRKKGRYPFSGLRRFFTLAEEIGN
jgi:hypothetical protein